ncbi:unnamed protein product [Gadus morhua 'NCC']
MVIIQFGSEAAVVAATCGGSLVKCSVVPPLTPQDHTFTPGPRWIMCHGVFRRAALEMFSSPYVVGLPAVKIVECTTRRGITRRIVLRTKDASVYLKKQKNI